MTPFELDLGWKPKSPMDMVGDLPDDTGRCDLRQKFVDKLNDFMLRAKEMVLDAQTKQKRLAD